MVSPVLCEHRAVVPRSTTEGCVASPHATSADEHEQRSDTAEQRRPVARAPAPVTGDCKHLFSITSVFERAPADALVWVALSVWAFLGVYVSATDLRRAVIPRRAVWIAGTAVAILLALAAGLEGDLARFGWAGAGAASVGIVLEIVYRLRPGRIGFGDVRLIILNGLLAGWWGLEWSWWALCAGAVAEWPVAVAVLRREGRGARVRWAPGLVAGTAAVVTYLMWTRGAAG